MVVNTEWGAFGDKGEIEFVRNEFDRQLDEQSVNAQHQLYVYHHVNHVTIYHVTMSTTSRHSSIPKIMHDS